MITALVAPLIGRPQLADSRPQPAAVGVRVDWTAACPVCGELAGWSALRDDPRSLDCDCPCLPI